ncbi:MAG: AraC family transcriptional regulator [Tannerellaceae bacterium]|jgi:AraC-like DNA-binding protein|nr:AraC family transcriptional regulator [Tannerellaceae bacterium]
MDDTKIINYSNVFLSCFSDGGTKHARMAKEHYLSYVYAGEMQLEERGRRVRLCKGECAFICKDNRIQISKMPAGGEQFKSITLSFPRVFLREFYDAMDKSLLPADARHPQSSVNKLVIGPDIISLFESMTPYFDSPVEPTPELIRLKMYEGVYCILNADINFCTVLFDFSEPWRIDILDYLNENYMYDLSVGEIANFTGRSLATFKRDFRKVSSLPPQKWIMRKRLQEAHDRLCSGNRKVSDVCYEVGFKSLSHFSRLYKETFGDAPSK